MKKYISIFVLTILFVVVGFLFPVGFSSANYSNEYVYDQTPSWEMLCAGNVTIVFDSYDPGLNPIWRVQCYPYSTPEITFTAEPTYTPEPTITPEPTNTQTPTSTSQNNAGFIIDHNSVGLFSQIPPEFLDLAFQKRFFFMDQSVGGNIYEGINCLASPYANALNHCKRWNHTGIPSYSVDPSEVYWEGIYPSNNVTYEFWPNNCTVSMESMFNCFISRAEQVKDNYDILSFQPSYLQVDGSNSWIMSFWNIQPTLESWALQNPNKTVIYWTTSLSRGIGTQISTDFNNQMRQWAIQNNKILFDVADILSHDPQGNECYDNRDGVAYTSGTKSENYPDDGLNLPAICPHYTTEVDGGHLGSVSAGKIRVAKAFWVLMARLSGWNP